MSYMRTTLNVSITVITLLWHRSLMQDHRPQPFKTMSILGIYQRLKNGKMFCGTYDGSLKQRRRQHSIHVSAWDVFGSRGRHERHPVQQVRTYLNILRRQDSISVDGSIRALAVQRRACEGCCWVQFLRIEHHRGVGARIQLQRNNISRKVTASGTSRCVGPE